MIVQKRLKYCASNSVFLIEVSHGKSLCSYTLVWFSAKVPVTIVTNTRNDVEMFVDFFVNS